MKALLVGLPLGRTGGVCLSACKTGQKMGSTSDLRGEPLDSIKEMGGRIDPQEWGYKPSQFHHAALRRHRSELKAGEARRRKVSREEMEAVGEPGDVKRLCAGHLILNRGVNEGLKPAISLTLGESSA
jgi:hypothetical protein